MREFSGSQRTVVQGMPVVRCCDAGSIDNDPRVAGVEDNLPS